MAKSTVLEAKILRYNKIISKEDLEQLLKRKTTVRVAKILKVSRVKLLMIRKSYGLPVIEREKSETEEEILI